MPLRLNGSSYGYIEISAAAGSVNNTLVLPNGNGRNRQAIIGDGFGNLSFEWDSGSLFYRLNSDRVGADVSTAQNLFGVGPYLSASTVYKFDSVVILTKTAGTTAHSVGLGFGGTATVNNFFVAGTSATVSNSGAVTQFAGGVNSFTSNSVSNMTVSPGFGTGISACYFTASFKGTVSVNTAGSFLPQYTLSAAPGGAYSTIAGSYITFTPIGVAGSNSSQGTWTIL